MIPAKAVRDPPRDFLGLLLGKMMRRPPPPRQVDEAERWNRVITDLASKPTLCVVSSRRMPMSEIQKHQTGFGRVPAVPRLVAADNSEK